MILVCGMIWIIQILVCVFEDFSVLFAELLLLGICCVSWESGDCHIWVTHFSHFDFFLGISLMTLEMFV